MKLCLHGFYLFCSTNHLILFLVAITKPETSKTDPLKTEKPTITPVCGKVGRICGLGSFGMSGRTGIPDGCSD